MNGSQKCNAGSSFYGRYFTWLYALAALLLLVVCGTAAAERITYIHTDILGSPVAASDESGNLLWREQYEPYGEQILRPFAPDDNTRWYTGKPFEEDLNLSYFGGRWYDPAVGRFMAMDPVDVQAGNLHSFNRYAYANNNPYRYVDPDGNSPLEWFFLAGDIASAVANIAAGNYGAAAWDIGNIILDAVGPPGASEASHLAITARRVDKAIDKVGDVAKGAGRTGKQARLRELANDDKLGSADRGWIKQEMNSIERGQRKNIRNPPGKDLAHERGREAAKGYGYEHSNLQDRDLHRLQHKYDNFGRKNTERPPQ
jgi:RHS repeat-associated protein